MAKGDEASRALADIIFGESDSVSFESVADTTTASQKEFNALLADAIFPREPLAEREPELYTWLFEEGEEEGENDD